MAGGAITHDLECMVFVSFFLSWKVRLLEAKQIGFEYPGRLNLFSFSSRLPSHHSIVINCVFESS